MLPDNQLISGFNQKVRWVQEKWELPYIHRFQVLMTAAESVRRVTSGAAGGALKRKMIRRLEAAGKQAAAAATQCMAAAQGAHNTSPPSHEVRNLVFKFVYLNTKLFF